MSTKKTEVPEEAVKKEEILLPGQIVVADGTPYRRVVTVTKPRGRANRLRMAKHFPKMAALQDIAPEDGSTPSVSAIMGAIAGLWGDESFDTELMPMLLGIENDREALAWYNGDGTAENPGLDPIEVFQAFAQASSFILTPQESETLRAVQKK